MLQLPVARTVCSRKSDITSTSRLYIAASLFRSVAGVVMGVACHAEFLGAFHRLELLG